MQDRPKIREGYLELKWGKIYYRIAGPRQPGIPLLCLHGGPGGTWDYLEPLEELTDKRPVIFYDQLGGGGSDRPADLSLYTVDYFISELEQVVRQLGLERFHLLGQSWGSMLATAFYLKNRPRGLLSLTLAGPFLSAPRFTADQRENLARMPQNIQNIVRRCEAEKDYNRPEYQQAMSEFYKIHLCNLEPWPDPLQRTFSRLGSEVYNRLWGPSEFTVEGELKDYDLTPRLGEITIPALLTCGEYDESTPKTTAFYHRLIPGSQMQVFAGATHSHHLEQPELFLKILSDFLSFSEKRP